MPNRKRPVEHGEDEDDSASSRSSSPADSSPQQGSEGRKRRRVTNNSDTTPEHTGAGMDDASDEDESTDEDEMALDEAFHTQQVMQKRDRIREGDNSAKEAGILTEVVIHDFMCHHHFTFTLGPNINFVCGRNGSGKSAILTAIIICFGGRADRTNRGGKIKDLIKHGADKAYVSCTLKNEGDLAYQPETYGKVIVIERHFTRSGTGGYKLYGENRRSIISTKKADLEAIIDHFALQTENTLNVLDQDAARAFISSSDPGEKYKLFVKGVQLERLDQDYTLLADRLLEMEPKLALKSEDVDTLKKTLEHRKELRKQAERSENLSLTIKELVRQAYWSQVRDHEKVVDDLDQEIVVAQRQIQEAQANVDKLEADYQEADDLYQQKFADEQSAEARFKATEEEHRQENNALKEVKVDHETAKVEVAGTGELVKTSDKQISRLEQDISKEQERLLELNGGGAARRLRELEDAKLAAQQASHNLFSHKEAKRELDSAVKAAGAREMSAKAENQRLADMAREQRNKLRELQDKGAQMTAGFRQNSDKLEAAIQRETRWQYQPIGPCGKYVRLLKPDWASIIEKTLGGGLSDFLVFSKQDADLLDKIKKQVRCDAGVSVVNRLPLTPHVPDIDCDTILKVLDIDNEHIKKQFIVANAIEQMLLVADLQQATSIMYDSGRLRNVKGCFAIDPNDRRKGILLKYGASGEPSQDPVPAYAGAPRMKSDHQATINAKKQLLQETERDSATAHTAWQSMRTELLKANTQLKAHHTTLVSLQRKSQEADDLIVTLEDAIKDDNVESGKLDSLKTLLSEAEDQKKLYQAQFNDAFNAADAKQKIVREHRHRLREIEERQQTLKDAREETANALRTADHHRQIILRNKNNAIARVGDTETRLQDRQRDKAEAERDAAAMTEMARTKTKSERVNVPDDQTTEELAQKVANLRKERAAFQQRMGMTHQEAVEAEVAAKEAFNQSKGDLRELTEVRDQLTKSLEERRRRWKKFRQHITARAKTIFRILLGERGFRGELLMDHRTHGLDLKVEPDISRRSGEGRSAKTLSGGEKSFSQICLLLAMWEAMGSPIRCLDEFDVFMDAVNRNISVRLITEAARSQAKMQYILISPGSKADFVRAPDVTVLDLGDPRTRDEAGQQRTLGESGFETGQRT